MKTPQQVYDAMMAQDAFSQWMDVQLIEIKSGYCKLSMVVRDDMLNGFKILHGGVYFSFADSALAFACNADNNLTLSTNGNINFQLQAKSGDQLIATAQIKSKGNSISIYTIDITRSAELLSSMTASVYHTKKPYLD